MTALLRPQSPDELAMRLYQQELVADFGLMALSSSALERVFQEACVAAARGLNTRLAKVLRYRPATGDFLVAAGVGWQPGVVGRSTIAGGMDSPAGYAMLTKQPTLTNSLSDEGRFRVPALLAEHAVQSAINVVIGAADGESFGVLEVDSTHRHDFEAADTAFLQSLANVLAAAISRTHADSVKDSLLREKDLLMQEVHHRVKNSLQLVHTMLQVQARTADAGTKRHLDDAAGRIMTIGAVHHRLYAGASVAHADAAEFLNALLGDLRGMLCEAAAWPISLDCPAILLSADAVTPLGLIVSELVTNAVKYGAGPIAVRVAKTAEGIRVTVEDAGPGFPAGFEPQNSTGLGMRLMATLAHTNQGAITIDRSVPHARISVLLRP